MQSYGKTGSVNKLAVGLGLLAAFAAGCGDKSAPSTAAAAGGAMPVQFQAAETKQIPDTSEVLSVLKSRHSSAINPQAEGQITNTFVKSASHVNHGEPLL